MNPRFCLLISLFLVFHNANAFNITKILSAQPSFSSFNDYLTKTNLAGEINSRKTITVLAVADDNMSPLSDKPAAVQKNILSVHIILDYYDAAKLKNLKNSSTTLTTLFQSTGLARGQQGFLNVTHPTDASDRIMFGSAMEGAGSEAVLIESVDSEPYMISVLSVTNLIIPPGIDSTGNSTTNNSTRSASPKASPAPPTSSPSDAPSTAKAPAGTTTPAEAPDTAPTADAPSDLAAAADAPRTNAVKSLDVGLGFIFPLMFASALFA